MLVNSRLDEVDEVCCDAKLPKKVNVGFRTFGGYTATCSNCSFVCGYWECSCELEHDCEDY